MPEVAKSRPKFLNLGEIRLPLPAFVSILHRVSGAGLFLLLPFLIWLLDKSLGNAESYAQFQSVVTHPLALFILLGLLWAFLHHFCAGIRFLLLDVHVGIDKAAARASSGAVLVVSLGLTAILGLKLLGCY